MEKDKLIMGLNGLIERLLNDVSSAYRTNGHSFGGNRFKKWKDAVRKFLDENLPSEKANFEEAVCFYGLVSLPNETDEEDFWRNHGNSAKAYIESLIIDIQNDEYEFINDIQTNDEEETMSKQRVFIVHGHDIAAENIVARTLEKLDLDVIILHEQPDDSKTIIEKIEKYTNVNYAIVLYTPCDLGKEKSENIEKPRARQNVVFEHGYLLSKLGRDKVCALVSENVDIPGDYAGVLYVPVKDYSEDTWIIRLARNMRSAGLDIDMNKLA